MNTNNMPKFTANATLYKTRRQYSMNITKLLGSDAEIVPQATKIKSTGNKLGIPALDTICTQFADLINDCFEEAENSSNPQDAQAWHDLGIEMLDRQVQKGSCGYSKA